MCQKSGRFYFYASYTDLFIMLTFDDIIWVMSPIFYTICFVSLSVDVDRRPSSASPNSSCRRHASIFPVIV